MEKRREEENDALSSHVRPRRQNLSRWPKGEEQQGGWQGIFFFFFVRGGVTFCPLMRWQFSTSAALKATRNVTIHQAKLATRDRETAK